MRVACFCGSVYESPHGTSACPKCLRIAAIPTPHERATAIADLTAQMEEIRTLP
jgi:hypothetical protein